MSTQANVCACAVCIGSECKCGCQHPAGRPAASCQCGEVWSCGPTCNCKGCQHANAHQSEGPVMRAETIRRAAWYVAHAVVRTVH